MNFTYFTCYFTVFHLLLTCIKLRLTSKQGNKQSISSSLSCTSKKTFFSRKSKKVKISILCIFQVISDRKGIDIFIKM